MQRAAFTVLACLVAPSTAQELPKMCSAYQECASLIGDCCPNRDGVMLECCILGAIRIRTDKLEANATARKEKATEMSDEATAAAASAQTLADEAQKDAEAAAMRQKELEEELKEASNHLTGEQKAATDAASKADADAAQATAKAADAVQQEKEAKELKEKVTKELAESEKKLKEAEEMANKLKEKAKKAKEEADKLAKKADKTAVELKKEEEAAADEEAKALARQKEEEEEVAEQKKKAEAAEHTAKLAQEAADRAKAEYANAAQKIHDATCENNPGCAGLTGFCCPTLVGQELSGIMLGCCGAPAFSNVTLLEVVPEGSPEGGLGLTAVAYLASAAAAVAGAALVVRARQHRGEALLADEYVAA